MEKKVEPTIVYWGLWFRMFTGGHSHITYEAFADMATMFVVLR